MTSIKFGDGMLVFHFVGVFLSSFIVIVLVDKL